MHKGNKKKLLLQLIYGKNSENLCIFYLLQLFYIRKKNNFAGNLRNLCAHTTAFTRLFVKSCKDSETKIKTKLSIMFGNVMSRLKAMYFMLVLSMVSTVAWGADVLTVTRNDDSWNESTSQYEVATKFSKFNEPTVTVMDGSDNHTNRYNITYTILASDESTEGAETVDARGVTIVTDATTGTYVEKYYGDVVMGNAGTVYVKIIATPKAGGASLTQNYKVVISAPTPTVTFTPVYSAPTEGGHFGTLTLTTKKIEQGGPYAKTTTTLPACRITYTSNGKTYDITDNFTITAEYTGTNKITFSSNKLTYSNNNSETDSPADLEGTVTYTFTPKTGYEDSYASIANKVIDVRFNVLGDEEKGTLTMSLTRDHFKQENVTSADGAYTIHVYKYGQSDLGTNNHYQYKTPTPSLLANGTKLPINGRGQDGMWGDFRFIYKIVGDSTYYDDCEYNYFNRQGSIQVAGEKTDLSIGEYMYQVAKPGLVKVAVYPVLDGTCDDNGYGATLKQLYEPYKVNGVPVTITDNGATYTAYAAPQYFYIDVMKRQPNIVMTPNPDDITFVAGDKITMNSRFDIAAHMDDDSNGIEGDLKFGANTGGETDHFAYSFFISDRMNERVIKLEWDKAGDWNDKEGDQFSYIDWFKTGYTASDNQPIQVGDLIKIGTINVTAPADADFKIASVTPEKGTIIGETVNINGINVVVSPGNIGKLSLIKKGETVTIDNYVLITTAKDIATYSSHPYLIDGDYEHGTTYISMKGYGNENWTITFNTTGIYKIPYTARPWNHTRWDISDAKTMSFDVKVSPIDTKILLSYYYRVAKTSDTAVTAPSDKVVVPAWNNYDVTVEGGFRDLGAEPPYNHFSYTFTGTPDTDYTVSDGVQTHTTTGSTLNTTTGAITIGGNTGQFTVSVSATGTNTTVYRDPAPVTYTIKIVDPAGLAQWEVISSCKSEACDEHDPDSNQRFADITDANGRMHFLTKSSYDEDTDDAYAGDIYGGTIIDGVPGITLTVGAPQVDGGVTADWEAVATGEGTPKCCSHETRSVIVRSKAILTFDEDNDVIPVDGTFYKFSPTVNGFLTVDAKLYKTHTIVLIDGASDKDNEIDEILKVSELTTEEKNALIDAGTTTFDVTGNLLGDYTFKKPLMAGHEYYLYDVTRGDSLNLHGFSYQPAFIIDRNTTKAESETPLNATTFMNGLANDIPTLLDANASNEKVTFTVTDEAQSTGETPSNYITVGEHTGVISPKAMTLKNGSIFKLRVKAEVASTDASLGSCVTKSTYYHISIVDIPTYAIGADATKYAEFAPGTKVSTENIKTDIVMTFGGWDETEDGTDDQYHYNDKDYADKWEYKSKAGAHSRIGSELSDDDLTYNKTIDGFEYFSAGKNNPVDELNKGSLQNEYKSDGVTPNDPPFNNGVYTYASGRNYEINDEQYYNTTYRLPCRGSFLKFEPRESGILLVYLVQNGSCDYHEGLTEVGKSYQLKWRPLYITDETGLPVEMVNSFGDVGQFVPTGSDATQQGSYTLGISRCGKNPDAVRDAWDYAGADGANKEVGCAFDWSLFKGTAGDRKDLLDAWPAKGERQSIIRLDNGGFVLPHKAYVRYSFNVKAGKTYFVFQPGSKPEFGGFSFVPTGFPDQCKYTLDSDTTSYKFNTNNQEKNIADGAANATEVSYTANSAYTTASNPDPQALISDRDFATTRCKDFAWDNVSSRFTTNKENLVLTINDIVYSKRSTNAATRTFTSGDWESICLPFSVSEPEMKRVFGDNYILVTCDGVTGTDDRLHFIRHANQYIEAGRPYLIKPSKSGTMAFRNVTIEGATNIKKWDGSALVNDGSLHMNDTARFKVDVNGEYTFKGVYKKTPISQNAYMIAGTGDNNGLHPTSNAGAIGGYRAFFEPTSPAVAQNTLKAYFVTDLTNRAEKVGDEPTGIFTISADGEISDVPTDAGVYTISGQKVSDNPMGFNTAAKGIYIINGKKYVK